MKDFFPACWRSIFEHNGLSGFDDLWDLELTWLEEPNHYRGGWSGVARFELEVPGQAAQGFYLKRQENYFARTALHPIRGIPTVSLEFRRICQFNECGIPTLEPVFFGQRANSAECRAILTTRELGGYESLEDLESDWARQGWPDFKERHAVIHAVADLLSLLHRRALQHGSAYPKHIFLKVEEIGGEARLIDLERVKRRPFRYLATLRDLDSLNRHSMGWSKTDRMRFLIRYLGLRRPSPGARRLWRTLARKQARKRRKLLAQKAP